MTADDLYEELIELPEEERLKRLRSLSPEQARLIQYK